MAKKNDDNNFDEIAKLTGGELAGKIEKSKYFIDTGSLALNRICSGKYILGGVPGGRITEIYGPNSSAKSLIGSNILFGTQKLKGYPIKIDTENADNPEFMVSASHLDINRVIRYTPSTLEDCFGKIYNVIKKIRSVIKQDVPIVIVYDSLSVSPCARELRETDLEENSSDADWKKIVGAREQPGERAKICSKELRKLTPLLEENNATLIFINQTRQKIGIQWGSDEAIAGGGNALPFYASCRIRTQTQKKIEHGKLDKSIGVNIKIKNVKNRSCAPYCESEGIQLLFAHGVNPVSGLLSLLVQDERIESTAAGRYVVKEKYIGIPDKANFRASKERNDIPVEVLINHPKLIDAETSEEVVEYLLPFNSALDIIKDENVVEKKIVNDEMDATE